MISIRRHLTRRMVAGTFLIAAGGLLTIFVYLRFELLEQLDNALLSRARTLGSLVQVDQTSRRLEFELTERAMAEYRAGRRPDYFEVVDSAGAGVIARSDSLGGGELSRAPAGQPFDGRKRFYHLTLPDGRRGRAVELLIEPGFEADEHDDEPRVGPAAATAATAAAATAAATAADAAALTPPGTRAPTVTLLLATDLAEVNEAFRHVLGVLLIVLAAVSVATVVTVVRTVRRGLQPLRDIGDAVARVDPATLATRFDVAALPEELRPVAEKLNELLARLDAAFRRERRFTSNVAHELRTPLAELRALAEVALAFPEGSEAAAARDYRDVLGIAKQMESVVAALLVIARWQAGQQRLPTGEVDLADALADAWRPHAPRADARGLDVRIEVPDATVAADRAVLTAMLGNLLANAVTYAPRGGRVTCRTRPDAAGGGRRVLEIENTNDSLTPADLPFLAEPFWRKDAARTDPGNSGLGLALVATYAALLGIDLDMSLPSPDVFKVALRFPGPPREVVPTSAPDEARAPAGAAV